MAVHTPDLFNPSGEKTTLSSSKHSNAVSVPETTYLDHAGTTPYPRSLMKEFERDMNSHLFGNPHSNSPSSMLSTDSVESARLQALRFFKADPEHFDLVFVANATAAITIVVDCLSDYHRNENGHILQGFWYGYHADSHTSLRETSRTNARCFESDEEVEKWLSLREARPKPHPPVNGEALELFAYPAQSNMNGRRLPLDWPARLRSSSKQGLEAYSLLDAAAYVATSSLDLSNPDSAPDFTALSFYKIFEFPDLGALIVRKAAGYVLTQRRYFGGGTVDMVINGGVDGPYEDMWHANKSMSLHEMLEDGTPAFHSIAALISAFKVHQRLFGSMTNVAKHTCSLVERLYESMSALSHADGLPLCRIYKDFFSRYGDFRTQGPTIAFNIRNSKGDWIGKSDFETLAILNHIQIRTGGVCNPGGIAADLRISPKEMRDNFREGVRCGNDLDEMNGKPTGIVRVSLRAMSSMRDVETFMRFLRTFVDTSTSHTHGDGLGIGTTATVKGNHLPISNVEGKSTRFFTGSRS